MELVLLTAHCWFRPGNQNYSVSEWTTTRSLFSCSLRCKLLEDSAGFIFVENELDSKKGSITDSKDKNGHRKNKYKHPEGSQKTGSGSDRSMNTGQCYCNFIKGGPGISVELADSNQCLFKTEQVLHIGDNCKQIHECKGTAVSCIRGICRCEHGYRYDTARTSCTKKDPGFGDRCTTSCKSGMGIQCRRGKCQCKRGYAKKRGKFKCDKRKEPGLGDRCTTYCKSGMGIRCRSDQCRCKRGYARIRGKSKCEKQKDPGLDDRCTTYCKSGMGIRCRRGKCRCKKGYAKIRGKSKCEKKRKARFGQTCGPMQRCQGIGVECLSKFCQCPKGYQYTRKESTCKAKQFNVQRFGSSCKIICTGEGLMCAWGTCMCKKGYDVNPWENTCVQTKSQKIGVRCQMSYECRGRFVECYRNSCLCKPGYYLMTKTKECVMSCGNYSDSMTKYQGLGIKGHNDKSIKCHPSLPRDEFLKKCKRACLHIRSFHCKTMDFVFADNNKWCHLSRAGYLDVNRNDREVGQKDYSLWVRNCLK